MQCSVIENHSVLSSPTNLINDQYLWNIEFKNNEIKRTFYELDPDKAYDRDMISIIMLKISGDAIIEPIFLIFKNCLNAEHSLTTGREIVSLYLKKAMSKISKTIAQSLCSNLQQVFLMYLLKYILTGIQFLKGNLNLHLVTPA